MSGEREKGDERIQWYRAYVNNYVTDANKREVGLKIGIFAWHNLWISTWHWFCEGSKLHKLKLVSPHDVIYVHMDRYVFQN